MPSFGGRRKSPDQMTRSELVAALVAFTVIVPLVDAAVGYDWHRYGSSVFHLVGFCFTTFVLVGAYRAYLGELLRRGRRGNQTPSDG